MCSQEAKLGWSKPGHGFRCQACHDSYDEDSDEDTPLAPPRWDGGPWDSASEPTIAMIESYVEATHMMVNSFKVGRSAVTLASDPCHSIFQGVGGAIWTASLSLAPCLQQLRHARCVVELGAGCGLSGIALALASPSTQVVLTDVPHLVPLMRYNALKNVDNVARCVAEPLVWNNDEHILTLKAKYGPIDVVCAADVTFDADCFEDLLDTIWKLSDEATTVLLAVPMREPEATDFVNSCSRYGLDLHCIQVDQVADSTETHVYRAMISRKRVASDELSTSTRASFGEQTQIVAYSP
jgi:predicted nicotinamide N-methyase